MTQPSPPNADGSAAATPSPTPDAACRFAVDHAGLMVGRCDATLRITFASRAFADRFAIGTASGPTALAGRLLPEVLVEAGFVFDRHDIAEAATAREGRTLHLHPKEGPGDRLRRSLRLRVIPEGCGEEGDQQPSGLTLVLDEQMADEEVSAAMLEQREREFRNLFELSAVGAASTDVLTGRFLKVNHRLCEITGYPEARLLDMSISDLTHPGDRAREEAVLSPVRQHQSDRWEIEKRFRRADGSVVWVHVAGRVVRNRAGHPLHTIAHVIDITRRREAEEELQTSRARERTYLDHLPVGIWFADAEGCITYSNAAGRRIWAGAKYVGIVEFGDYKGWWHDTGEPIAPDDWAIARAIRRGETSLNEEIDIECFDGTRKTILNSAVPVRDHDGRIAGAVVFNHDITAKKKAERDLRESEAKLSTIIERLPIGVGLADAQGNTHALNPAGLRMHGFASAEEMLTALAEYQDLFELRYPDESPMPHDEWPTARARRGDYVTGCEVRLRRRDTGHERIVSYGAVPVQVDASSPRRIIFFLHDITELKQAEMDLQKALGLIGGITQGTDDMIAALDAHHRFIYFNEAYAREFRRLWGQDAAIGRSMPEYLARWPEERDKAHELWSRSLAGESFSITTDFGPNKKRRQVYDLRFNPVLDSEGRLIGAAHIIRNVTERVRIQRALRESEEKFRQAFSTNPSTIVISDFESGRFIEVNDTFERVTGFRREEVIGRTAEELGFWPDVSERVQLMRKLDEEGSLREHEVDLRVRSGEIRTFVHSAVIVSIEGRRCALTSWLDITHRKRHEEQMRTVMAELNHRVKNTLAVVQSLASQTLRHNPDMKSFTESFRQRLQAMARAHGLLTQSEWAGTTLRALIEGEVASRACSPDRWSLSGPHLFLPPKASLAMHMVVHELTTNAVKHGAFRTHEGRIEIRWSLTPGEGASRSEQPEPRPCLRFEWIEHSATPLEDKPRPECSAGYGTRLVERLVQYELGGSIRQTIEPSGFTCRIQFPLPETQAAITPLATVVARRTATGGNGRSVPDDLVDWHFSA